MKRILPVAIMFGIIGSSHGALVLTELESTVNIGFEAFTAPEPWSSTTPAANQLDSNVWAFSVGTRTQVAADFGSTQLTGRGITTGGVVDGGVYAVDLPTDIRGLGLQATGGSDPGSFTLQVLNNTGETVPTISLSYTAWYYNDRDRSGVLRHYFSLTNDGTAGSYVQSYEGTDNDVNSPGAADPVPEWVPNARSFVIEGLNLPHGETVYLRWGFNSSGSGQRDEWAISGIGITAIPEPSAILLGGISLLGLLRRRR